MSAATWAAGEAVSREIPLKLVYVVHHLGAAPAAGDDALRATETAAGRAALADAQRAARAAEADLDVQTELRWGNPLAILIELSRSAVMVCVGSAGIEHACHRAGTTAAALAGSAWCPVAVIRGHQLDRRADNGYIIAEVDTSPDNNLVLRWALAEAKLRRMPLRVVSCDQPAQVNHLIDHWAPRYPEVAVEPVSLTGDVADYLADCLAEDSESVQLFVSGTRDRRSMGWPAAAGGCSVLTVAGAR